MCCTKWLRTFLLLSLLCVLETVYSIDDYNILYKDNSFEFGYDNPDSFHHSRGNKNNVVQGEFGGRNPSTGAVDTVSYTAGPRGYRPRGKNVVRKYDLNQNGPKAVGTKDDPYFDPNEDPSYNFGFKTRTYTRTEAANKVGDVSGKFSYLDDVGERHNVEFIAGKNTGYHVKTPFPDSNPRAYGPLFFKGRGKPIPRGRTSIQRNLDGSYKFVSAGPDQRRTETSDSTGHVRGSYTYLDDKGVQHTVHYIAGPETGYRVLKTVKGPHLPEVFPFGSPEYVPPSYYDYVDDVFSTSESGRIRPKERTSKGGSSLDSAKAEGILTNDIGKTTSDFDSSPIDDDFGDIFDKDIPSKGQSSNNPTPSATTSRPFVKSDDSFFDGGSYKDSEDDGSYKASAEDGSYKPEDESSLRSREGTEKSFVENDYDQDTCCSVGTSGVNVQIARNKDGAIVTNLGDNVLSVPPGVSVRAHVQAIDLIPLRPKVPSPSEQLKAETGARSDGSDQYESGSERIENTHFTDSHTTVKSNR